MIQSIVLKVNEVQLKLDLFLIRINLVGNNIQLIIFISKLSLSKTQLNHTSLTFF